MKRPLLVEFFSIGLVASFHLSVDLSRRNVAVGNAPIRRMPSGVVVRLDLLNSKGEMLSDLTQEFHSLGIVVIVDAQNAEARGFVDGRELVEASGVLAQFVERISLRAAWNTPNREGSLGRLGAWAILFHEDWSYAMAVKKFRNDRW